MGTIGNWLYVKNMAAARRQGAEKFRERAVKEAERIAHEEINSISYRAVVMSVAHAIAALPLDDTPHKE